MLMPSLAFSTTDWNTIAPTEHPGETGMALWRTQTFGQIRVRMVEYSAGYRADHWCAKGHIILCLAGQLVTELADGRSFTLTPGATCTQSNNGTPNGSATDLCAKMNIVITQGVTTVFSGTLATLAGAAPITIASPPAAGVTVPFSFAVTLASAAGNTYQGLQASLPLTWTFNS